MLEEAGAAAEPSASEFVPSPSVQPAAAVPDNRPQPNPERSAFNPRNIYPQARDPRQSPESAPGAKPADNKEEPSEFNFQNGYTIGTSMFWLQLATLMVAGLAFKLVSWLVLHATANLLLIAMAWAVYFSVVIAVAAYVVPYRRLYNDMGQPLWLTLLGVPIELLFVGFGIGLLEAAAAAVLAAGIRGGSPLSLAAHISTSGLGAITLIAVIIFFVLAFFFIKLAWGVAFVLYRKITNKLIVKIIGIGFIVCALGGTAYGTFMMQRGYRNSASPSPEYPTQQQTPVQTTGWRSYSNDCLKLAFEAPTSVKVKTILPTSTGACSFLPSSEKSNVNYWAAAAIVVGTPAVQSLPQGMDIEFSLPLPVDNSAAMRFAGLTSGTSVTTVLKAYTADSSNNANLIEINRHQAAVATQVNPDTQPGSFHILDRPYCPCTSKIIFLDTGKGSVVRITARWLNSDHQTANLSSALFYTLVFKQ